MKKFYDTLPKGKASVQSDGRYMEKEFVSAYCRRLVEAGVEKKILKIEKTNRNRSISAQKGSTEFTISDYLGSS